MCHRGFGFVTLSDEFSAEYTSQKVHRNIGYLARCVLVDVITYMIDRCLGPIDTHVGSRVSKERASGVSYAERFGVLLSMT